MNDGPCTRAGNLKTPADTILARIGHSKADTEYGSLAFKKRGMMFSKHSSYP